ncbi:type VI secretion system-associated protein TagF [Pseudomonas rubra]|uniref:Type VI secretion system-associated protein TagF n=1 Tax=Pseudomonas rubra TaxID=2942627 RepID=A0ABT5P235_9PSED|nr:type VI secretion system-associated protein TagF [Pseudomonas rubra]MDD1012331.1 type VI secretion system-associated protein TagF [Pseudomonas rubra]MDD1037322.1 type VI secretion system-associated protein TagF [Pseudomonas rubra]MDD1153039.1 type VI secretion system-associated protein TagF [Pseudomonas rubra]
MGEVGFYGKLASRGDFVSRGLPHSFIQPWDQWLAAGLVASQQQLAERWLPAYLVSPLWRFALAPGVCGPQAVVGVLMPSIDRVGRYFPLTLAQLLASDESLAAVVSGPDDWFEHCEAQLLATLEPHAAFEAFDEALRGVAVPRLNVLSTPAVAGLQRFAAVTPEARQAALAESACAGMSLWWGRGSERIEAGLLRCAGLPRSEDFASFLLGSEAAR